MYDDLVGEILFSHSAASSFFEFTALKMKSSI